MSIPFVLVIAMAAVFGPLCSWLALRRARSWAVWFIFGTILGPIAAALLLMAPPGRCPSCGTPTRGWPHVCEGCGLMFGGVVPMLATDPEAANGLTLATEGPDPGAAMRPTKPASRRSSTKGGGASSPIAVGPGPDADSPETRPATRLGRRASAVPRETAPAGSSAQTLAILGSGVFVGGSDVLQIGSRYFIARVGSDLQVLGPIHISPSAIAMKVKLNDAETTVVSDRVLITGRGRNAGRTLAFAGVSIEPGVDLEQQLTGSRRQKAAAK